MRALMPDPTQTSMCTPTTRGTGWTAAASGPTSSAAPTAPPPAGLSGGLQTPGDNRVFAALRDLADVVVAGAGTVRAEG